MAKSNKQFIINQFSVQLNPGTKFFTDFPNTAVYSPVSYIPQAVIISVLRNVNAPPVLILYACRIAGFLFWLICIFFTIKYIPVHKWLFTVLALLPMSVFIHTAVSADIVTNSLVFLFIGFILNKKFSGHQIIKKDLFFLYLICVLIALAKVVYAPVILLICIIPKSKFKSGKTYYVNLISICLIVFIVMVTWSSVVTRNYIAYADYNPEFRKNAAMPVCSNMHLQKEEIQIDWLSTCKIIPNTILRDFNMYSSGFIGTFGWMDTHLPGWIISLSYIIIFIVAIAERNSGLHLEIKNKIIFLIAFMLSWLLLIISQYLIWECVGNDFVSVIQGRYLIPIAPLFFMLFGVPVSFKGKFISILAVVSSVFFLTFSIFSIHDRYYKYVFDKPVTISCNFDGTRWGNYFKTSHPKTYFTGAGYQSDERSLSGEFSCILDHDSPYGPALLLYGGEMDDQIVAEVWIYGSGGQIAIGGFNGTDSIFYTGCNVIETSKGWQKIHSEFSLLHNMYGYPLQIFLWNPAREKVYFDNMQVSWY